jgi:hypothetical protein
MKVYSGKFKEGGMGCQDVYVIINNFSYRLSERNDLVNHSPDGLNWGYGGSGASQCALAILADCLGDALALKHYMTFKWTFVAKWGNEFIITEEEIREWRNITSKKTKNE